jgi:hypothetical protein
MQILMNVHSVGRLRSRNLGTERYCGCFCVFATTKETLMNKVLISLATAGLLLSASAAFSQNTETKSGTTVSPGTSQTAPSESGERRERSGTQNGERRDGDRSERRGERSGERREGVSVRGGEREGERVREGGERRGFRVRIGEGREGFRDRPRRHFGVYEGGCRTIIIKKRSHGETIVRRIRRCG